MSDTTAAPAGKGLNIALWVVQLLLALLFGMAGVMKLGMPIPDLAAKLPWVIAFPEWVVRFIGASELAGAIGLLLPSLTRIAPVFTPLAAVGLCTIMALAAVFHVTRGELQNVPINAVLFALAAFVAWGRFGKAPIQPRH